MSTPASRPPSPGPITEALRAVNAGDRAALDAVFSGLYPELKRLARSRLRQQGRADGLGTTTVLHESFIRLVNASTLRIEDRRHFFAYAARVMRHIITDAARKHLADRRGGEVGPMLVDADLLDQLQAAQPSAELVRVSEALLRLERVAPALAELIDMRYFGGYTEREIAEMLGVTDRTVRRHWDKARVWLVEHMEG